jgi:hypothetical protein
VLISKAIAVIEHTGAKPCETGIPENYGISLKLESAQGGRCVYRVTCKYPGAVILFPYAKEVNPVGTANQAIQIGTPSSEGVRVSITSAGKYRLETSLELAVRS